MRCSSYLPLILACLGFIANFIPHANAQVFYSDWKGGYAWPSIEASEPKADPDHDGLDNLIEYAFGSDPLFVGHGNLSYLPAMIYDSDRKPVFRFYWNWAYADIAYIPEESTDLRNWTVVAHTRVETIAADGTWETCIIRTNPTEKARFFRVRITGEPNTYYDSDGDGIPDYNERLNGTNPYDPNDPGAAPGRETYDPSQGIGTVVTPNPFFPEADSYVPRGEYIPAGTPDFQVVTAVSDNTKSTLSQSILAPAPELATGYALNTHAYDSQSGGTASIGNYAVSVPVNQSFPFRAETWPSVLERDKIYPITLTNVNGANWDFQVEPQNFRPAWTTYEKHIHSINASGNSKYPTGFQVGGDSPMVATVTGSGRLVGDKADTVLSADEKRKPFSFWGYAHGYGGDGTYANRPQHMTTSSSVGVSGDGVSRSPSFIGGTRQSSDQKLVFDDPDSFRYTTFGYEYYEYGGAKGLTPGVIYTATVEVYVLKQRATHLVSPNYVPGTRDTQNVIEMRMMAGMSLPKECVVSEWELTRGSVVDDGNNNFVFTADYEDTGTYPSYPLAITATATFYLPYEDVVLSAGVDETAGARYRKIALNGQPLPDGKPQTQAESDATTEETFVDALTLQLRHQVTDALAPAPTSDLTVEARRSFHSEVWNHRFGLRPDERRDLPFGVGWSSNLAPSLRFEENWGTADSPPTVPTATVTDEQGASYRFLWEKTSNGADKFTPFPTGRHEKSTYLCKLEKVGDQYHFTKKYGTVLIYASVSGDQVIPADRMVTPAQHGDRYTYARLVSVEDRLGNALDYSYTGADATSLIPTKIAVRNVAGLSRDQLKIDIRSEGGVITDIWDAHGYHTSYHYKKMADGVRVLEKVTRPDGTTVKYAYALASDADLRPKNSTSEKPDPDYLHYHVDLASVTDANEHTTAFEYRFDRSREDYSTRFGYYTKTGLPRNLYKTTLADGTTGATFVNNSLVRLYTEGSAENVTLMGDNLRRRVQVTNAAGYTRTYAWSDPALAVVKVPPPLGSGPHPPSPILIYYKQMDITLPGYGTETFTFNPDAGMALASATDLSGNTTRFYYEDPVPVADSAAYNAVVMGKQAGGDSPVYLNTYYDEPTSQLDATGHYRYYTYNSRRLLESTTDELGRVTKCDFDEKNRRWRTRIFAPENLTTPVSETLYGYDNALLPGFVTTATVRALDGIGADLVTAYTPDDYGRVYETIVDPGNLAITSRKTYARSGVILTATDPNGYTTAFAYDKRHRLTDVAYPDATGKTFEYDAAGNKTADIDERGNRTSYEYDALNRVTKTTRHMGGEIADIVTSQTYTALGRVAESTDARNFKTRYTYDDLGRPKTVTSPSVQVDNGSGTAQTKALVTSYAYDGANAGGTVFATTPLQPTSTTDPRGYTSVIVYDELYRPVEVRQEYAPGVFAISKTDYDFVGNAIRSIDALGHVTEITFDALNRPTVVTALPGTAEASTSTTDYTATGFAWRTTDELGRVTTHEHDNAGRKIKVTLPAVEDGSPMVRHEYDANGNPVASIDPLGNRTKFVYDARGRKTWTILPEILDTGKNVYAHPIIKTEYDAAGNAIKATDARGYATTTEYDAANRPIKTTTPVVTVLNSPGQTAMDDALVSEMKYDANGNVVEATDAKGNTVRNTYDSLNRLTATTDAENITVAFRYDEVGNKTVVIDGKGNTTRFTHDGLNRNLVTTDPQGRTVSLAYNAMNKTSRTDAEGRITTYTHDNRNRLQTISYAGRSQDNLVYAYDLVGNALSVTMPNDASGTRDVSYTYNGLNNIVSETVGRGTSAIAHQYSYDLGGNRTKTIYGGTSRELSSTYDSHNRVETITEGGRETRYVYDRAGNLISKTLPNGDVTTTTFDPLNRQQTITVKAGSSVLQTYGYQYDANSNVTRIVEVYRDSTKNRIVENTYDGISRLVNEKVTGAGAVETAYSFDAANNRETMVKNNLTTQYTYNSLNQLLSFTDGTGTTNYTYDVHGNRRTRTKGLASTLYAYDWESRLDEVVQDGTTYAYAYDYRTRRVQRNEGSDTTRVVFSGGTSYAEYTNGVTPSVEYIRGGDYGGGVGGVLYSLRANVPSYTHYNSRGDVTAKTDSAGAVTYQALYEAFGQRTVTSGSTADRQKANTKEEDPTGLLNEGFRYRDLETGTFVTRDPLGFIDGPNLYAYVRQNPWSSFDPEGLSESKKIDPLDQPLKLVPEVMRLGAMFDPDRVVEPNIAKGRTSRFDLYSTMAIGTKHGGIIDLGHMREQVDKTLYYAQQLESLRNSDGVIPQGTRFTPASKYMDISTTQIDVSAATILSYAVELAQRDAYCYEIRDPIQGSKFSPEDVPSNFLGTRIAENILRSEKTSLHPTVREWRSAVHAETWKVLEELEPLSKSQTLKYYKDDFDRLEKSGIVPKELRNFRVEPLLRFPGGKVPEWFKTPAFDFYKNN